MKRIIFAVVLFRADGLCGSCEADCGGHLSFSPMYPLGSHGSPMIAAF